MCFVMMSRVENVNVRYIRTVFLDIKTYCHIYSFMVDLHYMSSITKRTRVIIDIDSDLKRMIKIAAAEKDLSIKDYIIGILEKNLAKYGGVKSKNNGLYTSTIIDRFKAMQDEQALPFTVDSTDLIHQSRDERNI